MTYSEAIRAHLAQYVGSAIPLNSEGRFAKHSLDAIAAQTRVVVSRYWPECPELHAVQIGETTKLTIITADGRSLHQAYHEAHELR